MRFADLLNFAWQVLGGYRARTALILLLMIALASVGVAHARTGSRVQVEWTVEAKRKLVSATVVDLPFFDPPRKRA